MLIPHKLGLLEISPPQSLLPSNVQILNLMLINLLTLLFSVLVLLGCSALVFTLILRRVHKNLLTTKNHDQSVEQRHYQDVLLITGGLVSSLGW